LAPDIAKSETSHSLRLFAGYKYALAENLTFSAGVEDLESVQHGKDNRLNVDLAMTAKVQPWFSIASTVSVRYDNEPLPGVEKTDVVSALNLVYSLSR
jgi:putative salt-induced outer membrane protein YdiY